MIFLCDDMLSMWEGNVSMEISSVDMAFLVASEFSVECVKVESEVFSERGYFLLFIYCSYDDLKLGMIFV